MVMVVWKGGETEIEGDGLTVRDVIDQLNRQHPAAKYGILRNEYGEILKPGIKLTNKSTVVVLRRPFD